MFDSETAIINFEINLDFAYYQTWLPIIKHISHVGYWISLITLLLSVIIFTSIKKLKCARNLLHVHLFISFIMRALMFIIKEFVFVDGLALRSDLVAVKGKVEYTTEHYSWVCKAITSLRSYFIQANYIFTLMEGIYLHNLMFLNLFSDKSSIRLYYMFGWGIPLVFIGIWIKLRQIYDDTMCWTTSQNKYVSLLFQAPLEFTVLMNFFLFLSITRVLCLKINTMYLQQRRIKYRRLIRSTLTLVLIYGVPFTISIAVSFCKNQTVEIVYLFFDQTFTAFQGLLMALIYCLLNSEVRSEVMHKYNSFRDNRQQDRRTRTISNTQQFTLPMQDEPFVDPPKNNHHQQWYKNSNL
ncbi:PREDICTED: secretin receptor-like [Nicrophorus vespilloides]|uniref:Secretin receptor-like n=1 Tax=Nicrophorus vespilloides TaxID=110193 RepID=A0ABM1MQ23_NICVS|nr:PREDICTED: secretin receptor-like [Nicrophorus vespilloides]